jgi:hypothetical protein
MKLSEAMAEGAKKRPQFFGLLRGTTEQGCIGTCAIGAAYEYAAGIDADTEQFGYSDVVKTFPMLNHALPYQRIGDYEIYDLYDLITYKNDSEHMSREEIAAWLKEQGY